jgi:O-acetylhomoserine/O-acetylserine sulfhydrylase-like pyridoxal-dependent enzyme
MSTENLPIPKYNNTQYNFDITAVTTGLLTENLGNPNFETLDVPKVAMLVGKGVDPADAGEIWHMFDQKQLCH